MNPNGKFSLSVLSEHHKNW